MSRRFDKALENATDLTLVEPNWEGILECVDMIRGLDVAVKPALQAIQKRYHNENPHVAHHALLVLEACVKNCGKKFHQEIATKEFMDDLKNIVIEGAPDKVKNKILELIQCWSSAFEKSAQYKIVCDTHSFLKMYGYEFPRMKESDAMFSADQAPDWADGDSCFRCRVEFGVFTRKHHCRSCGQIFCDRCSARQMFLPQFGIEKKVRVCETCYTKTSDAETKKFVEKISQNGQRGGNETSTADEEKRLRELKEKEEEELQLALALSMSEAETNGKARQSGMYHQFSGTNLDSTPSNGPTKVNGSNSDFSYVYRGVATESSAPVGGADDEDDIDPALSRYLDKRYWEQRQAAKDAETANIAPGIKATAPPPSEMSFSTSSGDPNVNEYASYALHNNGTQQPSVSAAPNGTNGYAVPNVEQKMAALGLESNDEIEQTMAFCKSLREQVEIMDNRMRSNMLRGRSVINDSAIHSLFNQLTKKHAEVLTRMNKLDTDREYYEGLQDHLGYIQEARKALDEMRDDHAKQRQQRLLEEQALRAQQMQSKLEQIRQKKYENILEQRHMALQRLQEEELRIQQNRGQVPQVPVPPQYVQGGPQFVPLQQPNQMMPTGPEQNPHASIPQSIAPVMQQSMIPGVPQPTAMPVSQMQHYQMPPQHPQMQYQVQPQIPPPQQQYPNQPVSQAYMLPGQQFPPAAPQYQQYAQISQPSVPQQPLHLPPEQPISHPTAVASSAEDKPLIDFD